MKILVEPNKAEKTVTITITCPEQWLDDNCTPLPPEIAQAITVEQGIAIIRDAVALAMGYQAKGASLVQQAPPQ